MPEVWFVRINGQVHGPLDPQQLIQLAADGKIDATTGVAQNKNGPWYPASKVRGLRLPGLVSKSTATPPSPAQTPAAVATPEQPQQDRAVGGFAASDAEDRNVAVQTVSSGGIGPPDGARKTSWPVVIVLGVIGFAMMSVVRERIYTAFAYPLQTKFEIIQDQPINNGGIREVYVRIKEPVTEDQVKAVAYNVKHSSYSSCPKTKVWFLLPAQRIGGGGWASATFRPELEVAILGSRAKIDGSQRKAPVPVDGKVLGQWIHDQPGSFGHTVSFVKRGDGIFMLQDFVGEQGDAATNTKMLVVLGPNRYQYPGSKESWMRINDQGDLEIHDQEGLVDTARRMN